MKNKRKAMLSIGIATIMVFSSLSFTACIDTRPKAYPLYYYNNGNATWFGSASEGENYTVNFIPEEKYGYTFDGWYDAETGGTKCTSADGKSIIPFSGNQKLTLYAHYVPNPYTVKLDYGGASATSGTTITAYYEQTLPQLPAGLTIEGKDFCGWYTRSDCRGIQVSEADGISQTVFDEDNFSFDRQEFCLYAGFTTQTRTITFRTETGTLIKTVKVEYGSYVADAANAVRVNGKGVLRWQGGISGTVTEDMVFIAEEYAPVIELDLNGGYGAHEVIAQAGSEIFLPVPEKEANTFRYWADESGKKYTSSVMPENGVRLKAVWQPKIVFDSNGGVEVEEIVQAAGVSVTLPYPKRSGYLFAGWYTKDEELFSEKTMPADGAYLKAGWYKTKTANKDIIKKNNVVSLNSTKLQLYNGLTMDLSDILPDDFHGMIKVQGSVKIRHQDAKLSAPYIISLAFYNDKKINKTTQLMEEQKYSVTSSSFESYKFDFEGYLINNKIYGAASSEHFANALLGMSHYGSFTEMTVKLTYADTTILYL